MSLCNGNGSCFQQCCCSCYEDDDCEIPLIECICGHRNHTRIIGGNDQCDIYCQEECQHKCKLIECYNFRLCCKKYPKNLLDCYNGMCLNCDMMLGKINFTDKKDECPICLETKDMIQIGCGHNLCLDCWRKMSETKQTIPLSCPLCRKSIW